MLLDVPRFKCLVDRTYLTDGQASGLEEAYCFAVTLMEARPLLWTVHLESGAVYSRLPTRALRHALWTPDATGVDFAQPDPWGAISSRGNVVAHSYLKDYRMLVRHEGQEAEGMYLFTLDYEDGGFAQDPEQFKTSNIIALNSGQLCAMPNNFCRFMDEHFVDKNAALGHYRRTSTYHTIE